MPLLASLSLLALFSFSLFSPHHVAAHGALHHPRNTTGPVGQAVVTTSGVVQGHAAPAFPEVSEYLGIPFGQSTAGGARWLPPTPFVGTDVINGSAFGFACPQTLVIGTVNTSEDCLTINVWNRAPREGAPPAPAPKAVVLWVYGGGFVSGDSSSPQFNGAALADAQDVVVVIFNYRVGIFGFPGAPGLDQQNVGLLDQRLAVEWVRDNAAAFGGDPARITLFGESAGGSSVDLYAFAWTADPVVQGLIAESGSALRAGGPTVGLEHPLDGFANWYNVSVQLGCGGPEAGAATVECARQKTVDEVFAAAAAVSAGNILQAEFTPWIDDKTVFADVRDRAASGNFVQKPLLIGSNYNESILFQGIGTATGHPLSEEDIRALDNEFRCGARDSAVARVGAQVPVWRYIFANDNPQLNVGATHGDEVALVFGNGTGLSSLFQQAWGAFAQDPVGGLSGLGWHTYTVDGPDLVLIAPQGQVSVEFVTPAVYDEACGAPLPI